MWALVDCDNFFCSCERIFRPELKRTPVVVLSNNDGCVVAMSKEAKAMGIKMGTPYYQVKQEFPGDIPVAFSSNYILYGDISRRIMLILREFSPSVYQYSIDEAMMDLTGIDNARLKEFGEQLAARVYKWVGAPVSVGIAPTKTLAKVAVRYAKKYPAYRKCCLIGSDEQLRKALADFPVEDVWGIGRRIAASLRQYNILTAADFVARPREWVKKRYHITGERTWRELRGEDVIDIREMETTRKSIMTSRSFPGMITELKELRTHVANYAARCAAKLRRQQSVCAQLMVFVQSNFFREDLPQYSHSWFTTFPTPTSTTPDIVEAALKVLAMIYRPGIHYKRAGVMVSDISQATRLQPDLFTYDPDRRAKLNYVSSAIDSVNLRHGPDTVILGAQQYSQIGADGKHIHFQYAIRRDLKSPDYSTNINAFHIR